VLLALTSSCNPIEINHLEIGNNQNNKIYIFVENYRHCERNERLIDEYFCKLLCENTNLTSAQVYRTSKRTNIKRIRDNPRLISRVPFLWGKSCADDFMWLYQYYPNQINVQKAIFGNPDGFINHYYYTEFKCENANQYDFAT